MSDHEALAEAFALNLEMRLLVAPKPPCLLARHSLTPPLGFTVKHNAEDCETVSHHPNHGDWIAE